MMWRYNNVRFLYSNSVDSVHNQEVIVPYILTYIKSKYALMEALRQHIYSSYLGAYAELDPKSVRFDKPFKV